ncbi:condensation domain-containing protein [Pedococcus sp. 2YAF34]|uniref:condensation domain-containing protein n=1 Tax=Pedococcus sp. 2YAF34 TaxID=3233032 RepID=UPI003F95AC40
MADTTVRPFSEQQQTMLDFLGDTVDDYYLMVESFVLEGPLDHGRLRDAVATVLRRHEVARSTVVGLTGGYRVHPWTEQLVDEVLRVADGFSDVDHAFAAGQVEVERPMDLVRELPLRIWVGSVPGDRAALWVCGHHLVFDGWSLKNLYAELEKAYDDPDALPEPSQYHQAVQAAGPEELDVPSELFARPYRGVRELQARATTPLGPAGHLTVVAGAELAARLRQACGALRTTPYALAVTGLLCALAEATGDHEAIVGSASTGRSRGEAVRALGYFSNTIFMGTAGGSPAQVLREVSSLLPRWQVSPRVQWERVLDLHHGRDLYPVKFAFERAAMARPDIRLSGITTTRWDPPSGPGGSARRVADISGTFDAEGVRLSARYRADVVDEWWVRSVLEGCLAVTAALVDESLAPAADPASASLLPTAR